MPEQVAIPAVRAAIEGDLEAFEGLLRPLIQPAYGMAFAMIS